ncbi:phosphotransferase [Nesterenkonia sp. E16_7]|uniref:phosphotransferase family protein n=1 Tax=unclassified Nesterenkonia TaxID=2629769 RepID=UPI001A931A1D|nr:MULTISPECIES: phosphotransferase [unclassified Nesterenkonia]MBO0594313.1 phosphotransferase [Nesterenkonia sp. E16_10]MBO0598478.1 phosphotransferase [Nesterenkonia sp. E16_7]
MAEHELRGDLLGVLRGPEAETLLRQSLETSGMRMRGWELEQIHPRSGAEVSARYRVRCAVPDADAGARPPGQPDPTDPIELARLGESAELTIVASTVELTPQQRSHMGAVRADSSQGTVHLWVHPVDPELPGLLVVERPAAGGEGHHATELESRLGRVLGEQCRLQSLQMLVLRPLRRAVYRAVVVSARGQRAVYLKVVRPARAQQLLARHGCSELIPAVADAGDGILVLDQAPGLALTSLLYRPTAPADVVLPDPQVLISALETLRPGTLGMPPRVPPAQRLDALAASAVAAGADRHRVQQLRGRIGSGLRERPGPVVPTHGDFHPANLFLDQTGRHPTGLIDADTVGPGYRVDDLATMLGHLLTLPSFDAQGYAAVPEFARRFHVHALLHADRQDLGARTAAVLLSLLPGAHSADQREHHLHWAETLLGRFSPEDPPR